jgi:hypothetical protein
VTPGEDVGVSVSVAVFAKTSFNVWVTVGIGIKMIPGVEVAGTGLTPSSLDGGGRVSVSD